MNDRFYVVMQAMSGNDRHETRFEPFETLGDAEQMVQDWMSRYMAITCIPHDQVEAVKAQNGGQLPDAVFPCPEVKEPKDLEKYNGYHDLGGLGYIFSLFLYVIYDEASALRFKGELNREYRIDTEYSTRADRMLANLQAFVNYFKDRSLDISREEAEIREFMKRDGFNPFEEVEEYDEIVAMSDRWGI